MPSPFPFVSHMTLTILRNIALATAATSVLLCSPHANAVGLSAMAASSGNGLGGPVAATKEDQFFPDNRSFDFRAFQSASDTATCGGKPLPVVSTNSSYAVCVSDEVRTIHPEDRVAFKVKVSVTQDGRQHVLSQIPLVSTVGLPIMYETSKQEGYLGDSSHVDTLSVTASPTGPGEAISLAFDPIGRTDEGALLVQTRIVLASRATLKAYPTTSGRVFRSVDGQLAKGIYTALFKSGASQTYRVGDEEFEVTVLSLPRL